MKLIASLLLFYPIIIPFWQNGPLDSENTRNPEPLTFLTIPQVETQFKIYEEIPDAAIRSRIIFEMIRSNNPIAVPNFLRVLPKEKDALVKTDILKALFNMRKIEECGKSPILTKLLHDASPSMRAYAAALIVSNSYDFDALFATLLKERSSLVLNLAIRELTLKPDESPKRYLLESLNSKNEILKAGAAAILARRSENPDSVPVLAKIAKDERSSVRSNLAAGLAKRHDGGLVLLSTLSEDSNSSIRSFVASSFPIIARLPLYLKLSKDVDWDVRRLAIKSLGAINDPQSIIALLNTMSDKSAPVRKAVEESLVALKPSDDIMTQIIESYLVAPQSRPSAIRVLGKLKFAPSAEPITKILTESNDDDITLRSIKALGLLKYNKAWKDVMKRANSANPLIRSAVGESLGIFAEKGSFDTLLKLSDDKVASVAAEAIKGMGVTKSSFFNTRLLRAMKQVQSSAQIRSNACWSSARTGNTSSAALSQLERLALEQVIPAMGMMEYDTDCVRISAVLSLVDLGKSSAEAKEKAQSAMTKLQEESTGQFAMEISGDTLKEFARQAELYMKGVDDIKPTPFPTTKPALTATRIE